MFISTLLLRNRPLTNGPSNPLRDLTGEMLQTTSPLPDAYDESNWTLTYVCSGCRPIRFLVRHIRSCTSVDGVTPNVCVPKHVFDAPNWPTAPWRAPSRTPFRMTPQLVQIAGN